MTGHGGRKAICLILLILLQTSMSAASENLTTDHFEPEPNQPDYAILSGPGMFLETNIDFTLSLIHI